MTETVAEYHRRRAAEEMQEAMVHADDITAEHHRRLAAEHRALAKEAEEPERSRKPISQARLRRDSRERMTS